MTTRGLTRCSSHATAVVVRRALDEIEIVRDTDERARITRKYDNRERTKHSVDSPTLETELAEIRARENGRGIVEPLACGWALAHRP